MMQTNDDSININFGGMLPNGLKRILLLLIFFIACFHLQAQVKILKGTVLDKQSDEPISFAAAYFKKSGRGELTDSLGNFTFRFNNWPVGDTLEISSVGYKIIDIPFNDVKDSATIVIHIEVLPPKNEAVVKVKYNRALWFWRKVIANKPRNDKHRYNNYAYEVYNKLELDLDNVNREKLGKNFLFKPFNFVLDYTDTTTEKKPFLPVYLTETISDYYYQRQPYRTREVIKAANAWGFNNESLTKQLGATYQNVDVYSNLIPVLDKDFISPFSTNGDNYYNFKLLDTGYMNKRRLVHFSFTAKRPGENTFDGDCWVHDTTFAIQKIMLRPNLQANINFVTGLTLIQEYKLINDTAWFPYKDKFVVDISPLGGEKLAFKGRKTTTYRNIIVNSDSVINELAKSKAGEDIILIPGVQELPDSFWAKSRFEPLNKNEQNILTMLDTLENNKKFIKYKNNIDFLTTGTKYVGNLVVGPWFYWITGNPYEGTRVRFDLATNRGFSEHWYLHGYLAYGFKDKDFKGRADIRYQFSRKPWNYIQATYKKDLDNGQVHYDELSSDNLFATFLRKPNVPFKYQMLEEKKLEYFAETFKYFSFTTTVSSKEYTPLLNLPGKELFPVKDGNSMNSFEASLRIKYAYQERFLESNFNRGSLGSDKPILELKYTHGFKGVLKSAYTFNKVDVSVHDYIKLQPYGSLYYNFFAGRVWGTLPYNMLALQPGNEWYYYSRSSFNLMNRFEYITDRYAGFNVEHNVGSGVFRYLSFTRKWKFRQFWEVKGVVGGLSDANKQLNFLPGAPFSNLDGKFYMEAGTGVDNIFKFFRVDFIWRVLPQPLPENTAQRFGVFFGFRVSL